MGLVAMLIIAVVLGVGAAQSRADHPKRVIYDTDMCLDVDDVGALAVLHALADQGEAKILAVVFNEVHPRGAAAIDAINTWYGRGRIPVGIYKGSLEDPDDSKYLETVAAFPHDLTNKKVHSALDLYRAVLQEQPDRSVTIISVGFLNNLHDLLKADHDLVARKVKELVVMAGVNNDGFNLVRHALVEQSEYVMRHWPTPLVVSQFGGETLTGAKLASAPPENPVREAYYRWFDLSFNGRSSWDQVAVLYGVRGLGDVFTEIVSGAGELRNGYVWRMRRGHRSYVDVRLSSAELAGIIEVLMLKGPKAGLLEPGQVSETRDNAHRLRNHRRP